MYPTRVKYACLQSLLNPQKKVLISCQKVILSAYTGCKNAIWPKGLPGSSCMVPFPYSSIRRFLWMDVCASLWRFEGKCCAHSSKLSKWQPFPNFCCLYLMLKVINMVCCISKTKKFGFEVSLSLFFFCGSTHDIWRNRSFHPFAPDFGFRFACRLMKASGKIQSRFWHGFFRMKVNISDVFGVVESDLTVFGCWIELWNFSNADPFLDSTKCQLFGCGWRTELNLT